MAECLKLFGVQEGTAGTSGNSSEAQAFLRIEPLYDRLNSRALIGHCLTPNWTRRLTIARRGWSIGFFCVITTPLTTAAEIPTPAHYVVAYLSWSTTHDSSRPQFAHTNISISKSRVRLAGSTSLSCSSPPQKSQCIEGGGWMRVRMRFPFAPHESERGNGTLKSVPLKGWFESPNALRWRLGQLLGCTF